ncbi:CpsD/CapB family tyrosine-protein kinase [Paracoccaceae bacterium GXU_MW_L88]
MEPLREAIKKAREQREQAAGSAPPATSPRTAPPHIAPQSQSAVDSNWSALRSFEPDPRHLEKMRIVSYLQEDSAAMYYSQMRTRVLSMMKERGWKRVAITSPTEGCGKTVTTLNLAFSLARQSDLRTAVLDFDMHRPAIQNYLELPEKYSMGGFLSGKRTVEESFTRIGENLVIGPSGREAKNTSEILHNHDSRDALDTMDALLEPDITLIDTAPMLLTDDMMAMAPLVDCVLLVVGAGISTTHEVDICERDLAEKTNVLGVILNKCRYMPEGYGRAYEGYY